MVTTASSVPTFSRRSAWLAACLAACLAVATVHAGRAAQIEMVSKPVPSTAPQDGFNSHYGISSDGRFVVFISDEAHLVPGQTDNNGTDDIFLYDRQAGTNILVSRSIASSATAANGLSSLPALSADGRYVAFHSTATDLIAGLSDTNGGTNGDVFLFDRVTGTVTLVSHASASATTTGNGDSDAPSISADGQFVAYHSYASDLVAGVSDPLGGSHDVFLYDRVAGTTALVSRSAASPSVTANHHSIFPSLSADGRFVVFTSTANNLVSGPNGSNTSLDIFLFDRIAGTMTLVSRVSGSSTTEGNGDSSLPFISSDGSFISFRGLATDLVAGQAGGGFNVFLYERASGDLRLVSGRGGSSTQAAGGSSLSSISADGRFVAFESTAPDLIPGQIDQNDAEPGNPDIFLFDRETGALTLASHSFASPDTTGSHGSREVAISADGRFIVFNSDARDLIPGLSPAVTGPNTYLFDRLTGATRLLTRSLDGSDLYNSHGVPAIDDAGDAVALSTRASLTPEDSSSSEDVYLWTDFPAGSNFFTLAPCRLFDSRKSGPAPASGEPRILNVFDSPCGIPDTAVSLAVNLTVTQPTGAGHLILHAGDSSAPMVSTINFSTGRTRANNAVLLLAPGGALTLTPFVAGNGSVHAILDVTGWFE